MITRELDGRLVCVRQTDHARAAGRLAEAWGNDDVPALDPRDPVVRAVARHDDGWSEFDVAPALDPETGAPHTYRTQPLDDQLEIASRSVERVEEVHPYAAWLVSRHFASFHAGRDGVERSRWVVGQVGERARMLAEARPDVGRDALHPHVLEANFDRLQLLDALSLALCEAWTAWESRTMASAYGEDVRTWRYERSEIGSGSAVEGRVEPWPFASDRVEVSIPARVLSATRWSDPEDLRESWDESREVVVEAALTRG